MNRRLVALVPLLATAGCSYNVVGPPYHAAQIPAGTGIIYIYRPDSSKGQTNARPVLIDNHLIGNIFRAGYVPFHVAPGKHTVAIGGSTTHTLDVTVPPDGAVYLLYDISFGDTKLTPVPAEKARDTLRDCKLLPGGYDARDRI